MKTARNQFGDAVGIALDAAVVGGVPAIELISYLGSYIDIVMRCWSAPRTLDQCYVRFSSN